MQVLRADRRGSAGTLRLDHCIPSKRIAYMDDYQDEILEWHAAEQDGPEPAEDAFEL